MLQSFSYRYVLTHQHKNRRETERTPTFRILTDGSSPFDRRCPAPMPSIDGIVPVHSQVSSVHSALCTPPRRYRPDAGDPMRARESEAYAITKTKRKIRKYPFSALNGDRALLMPTQSSFLPLGQIAAVRRQSGSKGERDMRRSQTAINTTWCYPRCPVSLASFRSGRWCVVLP